MSLFSGPLDSDKWMQGRIEDGSKVVGSMDGNAEHNFAEHYHQVVYSPGAFDERLI